KSAAEAKLALDDVLRSPEFAQLWKQANRLAHEQVVAVLTGTHGSARVRGDRVELDLTRVGQRVAQVLHAQDPALFSAPRFAPGSVRFEIFGAHTLRRVQRGVHLLDRLALLLPVLGMVALLGSVAVARGRRVALGRAGLGLAIGMAALLAGLGIARNAYLHR